MIIGYIQSIGPHLPGNDSDAATCSAPPSVRDGLSYENLQGALLELGNFFFFPGRVGIRQRKGTIRSEVRAGGAFRERRLPTHLRRLSTRSTTPLTGTPMHAGDPQAFRSKMLETKNETKEETNPRE
jgi:hypothetical protein